jgi:hypothetical protein
MMPGYISDHPLARGFIRIGGEAVVRENDAMLRKYFAEDYIRRMIRRTLSGDLDFEGMRSYFGALRAAFTGLRAVREQIVIDGLHLKAQADDR